MATTNLPSAEFPKANSSFIAYLKLNLSPACIPLIIGVVNVFILSTIVFIKVVYNMFPSVFGMSLFSSISHLLTSHPLETSDVTKFSVQGLSTSYSVANGYTALHSLKPSGLQTDLTQK